MRIRTGFGIFLSAAVLAQQPAGHETEGGIVRGTFLERDGAAGGNLLLRTVEHRVYCFRFDARTYVERGGRPASMADIGPGDAIEIVADPSAGASGAYARTVHVVTPAQRIPRPSRRLFRPARDLTEDILPRGNLTYAGRVVRVRESSVVVRTRTGEEKRLVTREDTRFLRDGVRVGVSALEVNTRVFVRAGRSIEGETEAYQVIWGAILRP